MNYTYIVQCADGTLYTGWTNCLARRMKAHNEGKAGADRAGDHRMHQRRNPSRFSEKKPSGGEESEYI